MGCACADWKDLKWKREKCALTTISGVKCTLEIGTKCLLLHVICTQNISLCPVEERWCRPSVRPRDGFEAHLGRK